MTYGASEMRGATLYAKLIAMLFHDEAHSIKQLADSTGLHFRTVQRYIKALRETSPTKCVFIADWDEDATGRRSIPLYKFGAQRDMVQPKLSASEKYLRKKSAVQRTSSIFNVK